MEALSSYSQYLELIALVIGIIRYKEFKNHKFKYVLYFLFYVVVNEFVAGFSYELFSIPNTLPYNIYILVHFAFFLAWFHSILASAQRRKIIKVFFISVSDFPCWNNDIILSCIHDLNKTNLVDDFFNISGLLSSWLNNKSIKDIFGINLLCICE